MSALSVERPASLAGATAAAAAWDALALAGGPYWSAPWVAGVERRLAPRYAIVRDATGPAGIAAHYAFADVRERAKIPDYYDIRPYHGLEDALAPDAILPLVIFGVPAGTQNTLCLRPDLDVAARAAVLAKMLEEGEAIAEEARARLLMIPFVTAREAREIKALRPKAIVTYDGSCYQCPVPPSWDEYLESLKKKTRNNVRRERKNFAALGARVETRRLDEAIAFLRPSYIASMRAHPFLYGNPDEVGETILGACLGAAEHCRVFLCSSGDRPLGGFVTVRAGARYASRLATFAPDVDRRLAAYFNVAYHEVEEAVREGVHSIDCGGAAGQAKLSRGAHASPVFSVLFPRGDFLEPLRARLLAQGRTWFEELRTEVATYGQFDGQVEADVEGPARIFEEIGPA